MKPNVNSQEQTQRGKHKYLRIFLYFSDMWEPIVWVVVFPIPQLRIYSLTRASSIHFSKKGLFLLTWYFPSVVW